MGSCLSCQDSEHGRSEVYTQRREARPEVYVRAVNPATPDVSNTAIVTNRTSVPQRSVNADPGITAYRATHANIIVRPTPIVPKTATVTDRTSISRNIPSEEPCYGEYTCQNCNRFWRSTLSWANAYQGCKQCRSRVYPKNQREIREADLKRTDGPTSEHSKDLCQKCISLGHYCGKYRNHSHQVQVKSHHIYKNKKRYGKKRY